MKREGFWRYATPPVNIQGVPLPFTMIYLFISVASSTDGISTSGISTSVFVSIFLGGSITENPRFMRMSALNAEPPMPGVGCMYEFTSKRTANHGIGV